MQELARVKVDVETEHIEHIEHRGQSCGHLQKVVMRGNIYQIIIGRACGRTHHGAVAAAESVHGSRERSLLRRRAFKALDDAAQIDRQIHFGDIGKQRGDEFRRVEIFARDLIYGQLDAQDRQAGDVDDYLVVVKINAEDGALLDDIVFALAREREVFVRVELEIERRFRVIGFVNGDTRLEREVELGIALDFYPQIAQVKSEDSQEVADIVSSLIEGHVETYAALQAARERAHDKVVDAGSIFSLADDAVHIFGERLVALFDGLDESELVEHYLQVETARIKSYRQISKPVRARSDGDGARAEVGYLHGRDVRAEARDCFEHAVDERLVYRYRQSVVIGTFDYIHPILAAVDLEHGKNGPDEVRPILRDIDITVLRHRKPRNDARERFGIRFARYHAVIGAEEAVDIFDRDVFDRLDERRQIEGYLKALALPYVGRARQSAEHLTYIYIYISLFIIYARHDRVRLVVLDLDGDDAFVLDVFLVLTLGIRLLSDVEVDGEIQPVIQIRIERQYPLGKRSGDKGVDERSDVDLAARRLLRAELDRRGHLDMTEAISVGMVLHLGRNKRNMFFVPVGNGYRAVFYIVKRFARLMIDKRSPEFDQITVFIHRARERESAVGDHVAQIAEQGGKIDAVQKSAEQGSDQSVQFEQGGGVKAERVNFVTVRIHGHIARSLQRHIKEHVDDIDIHARYQAAYEILKSVWNNGGELLYQGKEVVSVEVFKQENRTHGIVGVRIDIKPAGYSVLVGHINSHNAFVVRYVAHHKAEVVIVFALTDDTALDVGGKFERIFRCFSVAVGNGERRRIFAM